MKIKGWVLLYVLVVLAIFLRLYKYSNTLNLDTDQAAAYIIADRILSGQNLLMVGPLTSIWQVNLLPPTYYYIIALLYSLSQNALFVPLAFTAANLFTILLVFNTGKLAFGSKTGLLAAFLFTVSEQMVWYGRNFWEPHLIPLFFTLTLLFLFKARKSGNPLLLHFSLTAFFMGFLYVSPVILLPPLFFIFWNIQKASGGKNPLLKTAALFFLYGFLTYISVIIYEFMHGYPSISALSGLSSFAPDSEAFVRSLFDHLQLFSGSLFVNLPQAFASAIFFLQVMISAFLAFWSKKGDFSFRALCIFLISGIVITGIYSDSPEVYRLSVLYPVFFLLSARLLSKKKLIGFFLFFTFSFLNLKSVSANIHGDKPGHSQAFEVAGEILSSRDNSDFTVYTILSFEKENHHSTPYWFALEKISGDKLVSLNERGNWIDQNLDLDKSEIFLVCRGFDTETDVKADCVNFFADRYSLQLPVEVKRFDSIYLFKFTNKQRLPITSRFIG